MSENKPAGVCKLLYKLKYDGTEIFIRQWYDCFEYVFSFGDKIYTNYILINDLKEIWDKEKMSKSKQEKILKNEESYRQVVMNLQTMLISQATTTIDELKRQRSVKHKLNSINNNIKNNVIKFWNFGAKQTQQAAGGEKRSGVQ